MNIDTQIWDANSTQNPGSKRTQKSQRIPENRILAQDNHSATSDNHKITNSGPGISAACVYLVLAVSKMKNHYVHTSHHKIITIIGAFIKGWGGWGESQFSGNRHQALDIVKIVKQKFFSTHQTHNWIITKDNLVETANVDQSQISKGGVLN